MPSFSELSLKQLNTCHPDLITLFNEVIKYQDCKILEGYRNEADQEKAFSAGNSKLHYPDGKHNHLPSIAVDVAPCPLDWNRIDRFYWFSGFVLGIAAQMKRDGKIAHDIRYGGDWNRNYDITDEKGLKDLVHFELMVVK